MIHHFERYAWLDADIDTTFDDPYTSFLLPDVLGLVKIFIKYFVHIPCLM